jgi:hypothetical protein
LNKVTLEKIGFLAVQLRVIKIDDSRPAPLLEVRASPNVWIKPDASSTTIDTLKQDPNKAAFDVFHAKQSEIRAKIGTPLEWEGLDAKRACRISVARADSSIDQVASNPTGARAWVIDSLFAIKAAFGPIIPAAALAAEIAAAKSEPSFTPTDAE